MSAIVTGAVAAGLFGVALAVTAAAGVQMAQREAAGAADAAALAAADAALGFTAGSEEPCQLAARTAAAGGAQLTSCVADKGGGEVRYTVRVEKQQGPFVAKAAARAGTG